MYVIDHPHMAQATVEKLHIAYTYRKTREIRFILTVSDTVKYHKNTVGGTN